MISYEFTLSKDKHRWWANEIYVPLNKMCKEAGEYNLSQYDMLQGLHQVPIIPVTIMIGVTNLTIPFLEPDPHK